MKSTKFQDKGSHDIPTIVTLLLALVVYVVAVLFNGLNGAGLLVPQVFKSSVGDLSDKYDLPITPAGFTFAIWSIIYVWLILSLLTLVVTIFLSNQYGRLYLNPPFATPTVNIIMTINFALNLTWIFLWDREMIIVAAVVLILMALTNMIIIALMAKNLQFDVYKKGNQMFTWGIIYRIMINGFGLYTAWTVIAALINCTHVLVYSWDVSQKTGSLTALSLLLVFHVTYFILENSVFDKYIRFLLTPYMVVCWALNGIRAAIAERVAEGEIVDQQIKDYVLALLIIACITLVVRIIIITIRYVKDPARKAVAVNTEETVLT